MYQLQYDVTAAYGENEQYEGQPFFSDHIDLTKIRGTGTLQVAPGIYLPADATKVRIRARLEYKAIIGSQSGLPNSDLIVDATREVPVARYPADRLYHRYRDGYLRRHLLDSGRNLSWVNLKEYEPGIDRKELLYHSSTLRAPGDRTRIYVPWVFHCVGDTSRCGASVNDDADAVYGGDENPLLRGGLAMATFALEFLSERNPQSLSVAAKLFDYVQASEWRFPNGTPSGFFLRSTEPGINCQDTGREYCYASIDEIVGMVLGLYWFNVALMAASSDPDYGNYYRDTRYRLSALVDRLGSQLSSNYFFVLPPAGLPQERQKGWSGGYPYQWYLIGGLRAITGTSYRPPGDILEVDSDFWRSVKRMPWNGERDESGNPTNDDLSAVEQIVNLEMNAADRAVFAIQMLGFQMYWGGQDYHTGYYTTHIPKFKRYNFPMLLHVFQLGMADEQNRQSDRISQIRQEMRRLVRGVVFPEVSKTRINLDQLLDAYVGIWTPTYAEPEIEVGVRGGDSEDYYAAAVAKAYDLFPAQSTRQRLDTLLQQMPAAFMDGSLPIGERRLCIGGDADGSMCDSDGTCAGAGQCRGIVHNPNLKIGGAFCWEKEKGNRIQGGGGPAPSSEIRTLYSRGLDAVREGAGLDYMFPTALLRFKAQWYDRPVFEYFLTENRNFPYLGACSTSPRLLAPSPPPSDRKCDFRFPALDTDEYELHGGNDSRNGGKKVEWGQYQNLTIDKVTHGNYRSPVVYAKFVTRPGVVQRIVPEQDRDYYYLEDDQGYSVHVTVESPDILMGVFVDEQEAAFASGDRRKRIISVAPTGRHVIMVESPYVTSYNMLIDSLPRARDRTFTTTRNSSMEVKVTGEDRLQRTLSYELIDHPLHGKLSGKAPNIIYQPNAAYVGEDRFSFRVRNDVGYSNIATVSVRVQP